MRSLWEIYEWAEKTFWNSLTKKLMSFLFLFLIDVAYLVIYVREKGAIQEALEQGVRHGMPPNAMATVMAGLDHGLYLMLGLTVVALAWNVLQILYIRHLIVRPVRAITAIFNEIARGEGDL